MDNKNETPGVGLQIFAQGLHTTMQALRKSFTDDPFRVIFVCMAKKDKQRLIAEGMFIEQGMTGDAIAEMLDIRPGTVSKWRREGGWDDKRDEFITAPHHIRNILLQELKRVSNGEDPTINSDALAKISKVMESLSNSVSPQVVITVIKMLDNWTSINEPKRAVDNLELHKRFIQHVIAEYGL